MFYKKEKYTGNDNQFNELRMLLIESYQTDQNCLNWHISRLEDWKFGGNSMRLNDDPDFFINNAHLWRNENGKLIGFCISEYGGNGIHIQAHPKFLDVESEILLWVEEVWSKDKNQIETFAYDIDKRKQQLLAGRGFKESGHVAILREYNLKRPIVKAPLASGFRIEKLIENRNYDSLLDAINKSFKRSFSRAFMTSILSAPSISEEWIFSVVNSSGRHISFCFASIDRANKTAAIDPIGTHPEYQKRGHAKSVIARSFEELQEEGIQTAFIASGPEPLPSNRLYDYFNPSKRLLEKKWVKTK